MTTEYIVIKIGGVASKQLTPEILAKLSEWQQAGQKVVIVHGGGFAINQLMEENHIPIHKVNGLRVTSQSDMTLIKEALVDIVGKNLAGQLTQAVLPAYQLVDELPDLVHADFLDQETYGFVGEVKNITNQTLVALLSQGKIPLIPSLGYSEQGDLLNINADYLARAVAISLGAKKLILMTDVKGVLENGQVLDHLNLVDVHKKIDSGVITGGMIPKIQSAVQTVQAGVEQVIIGDNLTDGTIIKEYEMTKLFSNYKRAAIDFASAQGNYLTDTTGNTYLDFSSGIGVTNLGYHPHVNQALTEQAGKILHQPNLYHNQLQEDVADLLIGDRDYLAFFCNSGAEANEAAIKIARKASGKQEIITFQNSFHGRTFGSMSATGQDKIKQGFGEGVPHFSYAIFNDIDSVKALASDETAAIMLELVQGESGVQPADKDFVKALADFCKETGIYLIVDEVQTGLGRTGKLYAYEHYDIEPDIFTLAKGLANGVPVGAMLAKSSLGEAFSYGSHGSTFGGNKLAMAAAKATLEVMLVPGFLDTALGNGNQLQAKLQAALSDKETVTTVRGLGYMIGIETTGNLGELVQSARDKGLILLTAGTNVIRLLPPITLSDAEIEKGVAILSEIFD